MNHLGSAELQNQIQMAFISLQLIIWSFIFELMAKKMMAVMDFDAMLHVWSPVEPFLHNLQMELVEINLPALKVTLL